MTPTEQSLVAETEARIVAYSCTGCYEAGDMGAFEVFYPWSKEHQCRIGSGCDECNQTGLVEMWIPSLDDCRAMCAYDHRKDQTNAD